MFCTLTMNYMKTIFKNPIYKANRNKIKFLGVNLTKEVKKHILKSIKHR